MNALQEKSFDLLRQVLLICEKWDIPYYLVCGSALGAVKYQGFIPWDDDIDVGFLRPDYERFLEIASKELPQWCFLQNYRTERIFHHTFSKVRDSRTTFIEAGTKALPINHGIYVDIFPIDGYPNRKIKKVIFEFKHKILNWIRFSILVDSTNPKVRKRNKILRALGINKFHRNAIAALERMYTSCPLESSECWCNYGNWQGKKEYAPKWHYGKGTWATFEGLRVRIPENYDAYLTQKYGDWRKDPPVDAQKTHHLSTVIDTTKSYIYYWKNECNM